MLHVSGMRMRRFGYVLSILCLLTFFNLDAYGEYPDKPIKIYATTTAGGTADLWIRAWSEEFSKILKVPIIIQPEGGASGMAALIEAAKAKPDGYTLTYVAQSNVVGFAVSTKSPFDLFKDFVPLGACGSTSTVIVVEKSSPFQTYDELVDYAKKNPGKLKCGSAGATVVSHFNFELLKHYTNLDFIMVPFKGSPQAITALLGKHVDLVCTYAVPLQGLVKSGRVRTLLTTRKLNDQQDVPTFAEKGLAKAALLGWAGIIAPMGVPKEVQAKLIDAFQKVTKYPEVIKRLEVLGFSTEYSSPGDIAKQMKEDYEKIRTVAKQVGISN